MGEKKEKNERKRGEKKNEREKKKEGGGWILGGYRSVGTEEGRNSY